ncbi:hypothetical protein NDU88_007252 [Pleurodeles waltl]|uniref:Uncharacterized protein n=1 Tax=Pleurodeles waltl TaxID=8319 RepID=A0AAV7SS87_PLEWA|nr:hypothetical protein NDU88_007252 [Pleurodeles waltl]
MTNMVLISGSEITFEPGRHRVVKTLSSNSLEGRAEELGRGRVGRRPEVLVRAAVRLRRVVLCTQRRRGLHAGAGAVLRPHLGCTVERNVPVLRSKRNRVRRVRKRGEVRAEPVTYTSDLEQLMQERREAIHSAAAISASPVASESETEISQPPSDRPITPD